MCAGRGQQAQMAPAAFPGEGEDALERRLPGDREIDVLGGVPGRAVKLVEQSGARRARARREGQQRGLPVLRARPVVAGIAGNIML